jgi:uncharacterized protein
METTCQASVLEAMMQPGFYPHAVASIRRCETHISTVFLTGSYVYKVKKPVDLGFLDFTTLAKREHCCRQEVSLNRRLSCNVYIDAVPITCHHGRYVLNGTGQAVEYTVKMHQLDEADAMERRLRQSTVTDQQIERLVRLLVDFYDRAPVDRQTGLDDRAWSENLRQVDACAGAWLDRQPFDFVSTASRSFHRRHQNLFRRRRDEGKIRDCHGDLRTDHIYFTSGGIQIIDCIEFSARLRCLDVISDLAFLAMDLKYRGFPEIAAVLIQRYVELSDDIGALPLLNFYCCYRAMVRCKVSCIRLKETGQGGNESRALQALAAGHLALARDYAAAFSRPILWMVCGLPASGKSTIAKALAAVFDIGLIRSDAVRKALFADAPTAASDDGFEQGLYSAIATDATYAKMFELAEEELKLGDSVVMDATFSRKTRRILALRLAASHTALPVFVECVAAESTLAARLKQRATRPSLSDARLVHLEAFVKRFDPMDPIASEIHLRVDTENPPRVCLRHILLADRLWQVFN